jgi:hypothetical protein
MYGLPSPPRATSIMKPTMTTAMTAKPPAAWVAK